MTQETVQSVDGDPVPSEVLYFGPDAQEREGVDPDPTSK